MAERKGYIYIFQKLYEPLPLTVKIGSTLHFKSRMYTYRTNERYFNNDNQKIWKFTIIDSCFDCYQLDKMIQYTSRKYKLPYVHFNGDGGTEHYYFTDIYGLCTYFDKLSIKYELEDVNIMQLISNIIQLDKKRIKDNIDDDYDRYDNTILSKSILEELDTLFDVNKRYQMNHKIIKTTKKNIDAALYDFRYRQKECYEKWIELLANNDKYWGAC